MFKLTWCKDLFKQRAGRLVGAMLGVGMTVTLLASVGAFTSMSAAVMTRRAVKDVPVYWQVQLAPGAVETGVRTAMAKTASFSALAKVGYADTNGFMAETGGTTQTTGPGKVLGLPADYRRLFPAELRQLTGAGEGVLAAQQTAANLHVKEGDQVTIMRLGLPPVTVTVAGVVDLPAADSLFQAVGVPAGAAPQAPPDNVLLLPYALWQRLFAAQATVRPDSVHVQFHAKLREKLPADPVQAYTYVQRLANHLEARLAGSGIVGNNLAARLDGVREDTLYARVLFLFLGLPGVVLAVCLTLAFSASGMAHRRQEQALLRTRGASVAQVMQLAALEALIVGLGGALIGAVATALARPMLMPGQAPARAGLYWLLAAELASLGLSFAAILHPAWQEARHATVIMARAQIGKGKRSKGKRSWWQTIYLDLFMLALGGFVFWRSASNGYQVILAPEGVPAISVHYEAFFGPCCLWLGGIMLAWRLWSNWLKQGRRSLSRVLSPIAGRLTPVAAASLSRQAAVVARGVIFVALALSFAVSTSIFNTTYNAQARVDAELTNGSDVTVTGTTNAPPGQRLAALRALPGVQAAEPMQHRFAYVGSDLQDIYGIDPRRIEGVAHMADAYFAGGHARAVLDALAKRPDGVLVSEETVQDFQLRPGDLLNLRLQNASDHQYHVVPFHFIGVVREFPTAPTDSFLVANAAYISRQTGTGAEEVVLMRAAGDPADLASHVRRAVRDLPGAKVTEITATERAIGSSLTAVDLRGLTRLELCFAVLMVAGAAGLILGLGLAERRRSFAVLTALGAKAKQLGAFIWSEGLLILCGGGIFGIILGVGIAYALVKVLTGVFDPPPQYLSIPWAYLAVLAGAAAISTAGAIIANKKQAGDAVIEELRSL